MWNIIQVFDKYAFIISVFVYCVTVNAAIRKPSFQNSKWRGWSGPHKANDGRVNTVHGSCAVIGSTRAKWWKVDLGLCYEVTHVKVTNRDVGE